MKLIETIAILIVLIILFVLAYTLYARHSEERFAQQETKFQALSVLEVAERVTNLHYLQCVSSGVKELACIDKYKVEVLEEHVNNPALTQKEQFYYRALFGNSLVILNGVYPLTEDITLYDNRLAEFTFSQQVRMPVTIYDPLTQTRSLGVLEVTVTQ